MGWGSSWGGGGDDEDARGQRHEGDRGRARRTEQHARATAARGPSRRLRPGRRGRLPARPRVGGGVSAGREGEGVGMRVGGRCPPGVRRGDGAGDGRAVPGARVDGVAVEGGGENGAVRRTGLCRPRGGRSGAVRRGARARSGAWGSGVSGGVPRPLRVRGRRGGGRAVRARSGVRGSGHGGRAVRGRSGVRGGGHAECAVRGRSGVRGNGRGGGSVPPLLRLAVFPSVRPGSGGLLGTGAADGASGTGPLGSGGLASGPLTAGWVLHGVSPRYRAAACRGVVSAWRANPARVAELQYGA